MEDWVRPASFAERSRRSVCRGWESLSLGIEVMRRIITVVAVVLVGMWATLLAASANAAILWNVTYEDVDMATGDGFDDTMLGATRRSTFEAALSYINTVVDHTGTVDLTVMRSQLDGGGVLATGGASFSGPSNRFSNGLVFSHATTGTDPFPGQSDGVLTFDFGFPWNSELDAPTSGELDLFSISLHEVTHTMGFLSAVNGAGQSELTQTDPGLYSVFDSFLERGDGTKLFGAGGDFLGSVSDLTSDDVYFGGPNAKAANGGNSVKLYAPGTFEFGTSLWHVDASNQLMSPGIGPGESTRVYSAIEMAILADIGWTLQAVPEPSTFALVGVASIVLVIAGRRHKPKVATTQ